MKLKIILIILGILLFLLLAYFIANLQNPGGAVSHISPTPIVEETQTPASKTQANFAFPEKIDPARRYLFYLHGKIIEDQGLTAVSPDYGAYQYHEILETLSGYGFVVISEQRPKGSQSFFYAQKVQGQVEVLLAAGVPAENITVVGASKGAAITVLISYLLDNAEMNFVLLGACHPDTVAELKNEGIRLVGNVLSIYDSVDIWAGSCQELFTFSELSNFDEIVLGIGTGHGILYQPLDVWIIPSVAWANRGAVGQ